MGIVILEGIAIIKGVCLKAGYNKLILNMKNKRLICIILLAILVLCSLKPASDRIPVMVSLDNISAADTVILKSAQNTFDIISGDVKTISEYQETVTSIDNRSLNRSVSKIAMLFIIAFVISNFVGFMYSPVYTEEFNVLTVLYMHYSDGEK